MATDGAVEDPVVRVARAFIAAQVAARPPRHLPPCSGVGGVTRKRPAGGFFSGSTSQNSAAVKSQHKRLWAEAGVRVVPGRYLAREQADGSNPGADYIRVAMVQDAATTGEALHRIAVLG